ncbi:PLP-dependent aminotransferase family protein [Cytobacillus firmus]|uniref:MocR-like pyridoxine biosynthesis transcription factor PdxR n=1 Tax=Cytobacillus firmus TaxID=1399 RepID=UPI00368245F2
MLTLHPNVPHYRQIYENIKNDIINGNLHANVKLPSIRSLAAHLNISTTPVEAAYQQLAAEGLIESRARKGFFVNELPPEYLRLGIRSSPEHESNSLFPARDTPGGYLYDFHISTIEKEAFPLSSWKKITNDVVSDGRLNLNYGEPQGELGLRIQLVHYLRNFRGVHCRPEQIIIAGDQAYLMFLLSMLLKEKYSDLAIENPGYQLIPAVFRKSGFSILPMPLDEDGINIHSLLKCECKLAAVTPSHQFPTGKLMSLEKRHSLLNWARNRNGYIIEDDYDSEFQYDNKPLPSLQGLSENTNVIYLGGFSQILAPAIGIHYMVLPYDLLEDYHRLRIELMLEHPASRLSQFILQSFMEQGYLAKHIRRARKLYKEKHERLVAALETHLGGKVSITGRGAGFHITISVDDSRTSGELCLLAKNKGIRIIDANAFYVKASEPLPPSIMIGFAGILLDQIEPGIKKLAEAWS